MFCSEVSSINAIEKILYFTLKNYIITLYAPTPSVLEKQCLLNLPSDAPEKTTSDSILLQSKHNNLTPCSELHDALGILLLASNNFKAPSSPHAAKVPTVENSFFKLFCENFKNLTCFTILVNGDEFCKAFFCG